MLLIATSGAVSSLLCLFFRGFERTEFAYLAFTQACAHLKRWISWNDLDLEEVFAELDVDASGLVSADEATRLKPRAQRRRKSCRRPHRVRIAIVAGSMNRMNQSVHGAVAAPPRYKSANGRPPFLTDHRSQHTPIQPSSRNASMPHKMADQHTTLTHPGSSAWRRWARCAPRASRRRRRRSAAAPGRMHTREKQARLKRLAGRCCATRC